MPNVPIQVPNIDLPGTEYLSLAPNRTIALQGRRRAQLLTTSVSIPAGVNGGTSATSIIETGFVANAGIYVHDITVLFAPADQTSELSFNSLQVGFGLNPASVPDVFYRVAPLPLTIAPAVPTLIAADRDKLILQRDIAFLGESPITTNLTLSLQWTAKNLDATLAHSAVTAVYCFYTRLDGVIE